MHCKGIPHALQRDFPLLPLSASRNVYPSLASWAYRNSSGWSILGRAGPSMEMVQLLGCSTGCVSWETWLNCQYKNTKAFWEVSLSKKALSYLVPVDGVLCSSVWAVFIHAIPSQASEERLSWRRSRISLKDSELLQKNAVSKLSKLSLQWSARLVFVHHVVLIFWSPDNLLSLSYRQWNYYAFSNSLETSI